MITQKGPSRCVAQHRSVSKDTGMVSIVPRGLLEAAGAKQSDGHEHQEALRDIGLCLEGYCMFRCRSLHVGFCSYHHHRWDGCWVMGVSISADPLPLCPVKLQDVSSSSSIPA